MVDILLNLQEMSLDTERLCELLIVEGLCGIIACESSEMGCENDYCVVCSRKEYVSPIRNKRFELKGNPKIELMILIRTLATICRAFRTMAAVGKKEQNLA